LTTETSYNVSDVLTREEVGRIEVAAIEKTKLLVPFSRYNSIDCPKIRIVVFLEKGHGYTLAIGIRRD
jgi:hypothetical protein